MASHCSNHQETKCWEIVSGLSNIRAGIWAKGLRPSSSGLPVFLILLEGIKAPEHTSPFGQAIGRKRARSLDLATEDKDDFQTILCRLEELKRLETANHGLMLKSLTEIEGIVRPKVTDVSYAWGRDQKRLKSSEGLPLTPGVRDPQHRSGSIRTIASTIAGKVMQAIVHELAFRGKGACSDVYREGKQAKAHGLGGNDWRSFLGNINLDQLLSTHKAR
ncbi:hypothetical protein LTR50_005694 [Elasticomyces elasticus]|nr:hypothetical protein LTR50_005694 [Elasticomyces elasticus]